MKLVFKSGKNLYSSPDNYVLAQKYQTIEWGTVLEVYAVYYRGGPIVSGYQTIKAMFNHEGSSGTNMDTNWLGSSWLDYDLQPLDGNDGDVDNIILFDKLGSDHPIYYQSKDDLVWYLNNIYGLSNVSIN